VDDPVDAPCGPVKYSRQWTAPHGKWNALSAEDEQLTAPLGTSVGKRTTGSLVVAPPACCCRQRMLGWVRGMKRCCCR
jgi:hypothetical protein